MPTFRYKALSPDGANITGVIDAYDRFEAVAQIKQDCPIVISVEQVARLPHTGIDIWDSQRISEKQLALVSSQFAIILRTGISVVRATELICDQVADKRLRKLLQETAKDVASGYSLAASLENKGGKLLPPTFIETVRAGEESGTLPESFASLKTYYERSADLKGKVTSAMMYPLFLLGLTVVVIAIIMVVTMPTFESVFAELDIELPGLTKFIMAMADFFTEWWWFIAIVILALILGFKFYAKSERGGMNLARIQLKLPLLGRVATMKAASQFANTLSTLFGAGIPYIRAVEIVSRVLDNRYMGHELGSLVPFMEEGRSLGVQLREQGLFPSMLCEMTVMGEETGSLETTLSTVGVYYDAETELASSRALSMIQPMMTVIMGLMIGVIVVGLYLPMFTMYEGL